MIRVDAKTFVLLCLIALFPLLFIANQSMSSDVASTYLDINLNSSSSWTQIRLEGATITGLEVMSSSSGIKHSGDAILMEGPGKARVRATINAIQNPVNVYLTKDVMGQASADINGIGRIENLNQPMTIPISLRTNSSMAKIGFNGLSIKKSSIKEMKGNAYRPIITDSSIAIDNPLGRELELDLLANASVYDEFPAFTMQKADNGTFQAKIGDWIYNNNKTIKRTIKNLPVTVEMTSNMTQIFFDGAEISRGWTTQIDDQGLQANILGDNFIFLNYLLDGSTFRRASFLMDLNYSRNSKLAIYKNNSGFVRVRIANRDYFLANSSKTKTYVTGSFALDDLNDDNRPVKKLSVPLYIETTSDWTDITLDGLEGAEIAVSKVEGNISQPVVSDGKISIKKGTIEDRSIARVEAVVKAESQRDGLIKIEKGGLGYARVGVGQIATFNNIGEGKGDPTNPRLFRMPVLPKAEVAPDIIYNPVAYILPLYSILSDQGLTIEETQPKEVSLSITVDEIPEKGFRVSVPVAEGIRVYILIAFLILLVFSAAILRLDARLGLSDIAYRDRIWRQIDELAKLPFSSALIIECLLAFIVIPIIVVYEAAWVVLIIFLLLITATALRLAGIKRRSAETMDWLLAKRETISLLLAATIYLIVYYLLIARQELGPNISRLLLIGIATTLCLLYLFFIHPSRRAYRNKIWELILGNLEDMPISSVIILDALICLAVTPFLLLSIESMANNAAILAYLLLVAGVAVRFLEMKDLLNTDKQKEMLIKILTLAILPTAGMQGASKLMTVNPGAGQILFALMIISTAVLVAFLYYYQRKRIQTTGINDEFES
ncbi:MAG: hypothetical protein A4E49_01915 [Methanosaeta sp. PtaU1.Bin112]|nr:MAG: hypothetical protein A4E49_01915 [Methanosaeta sp. PtaU1.Bin112]